MGVSDGGMRLQLEGDRSDVAAYLDKYNATSSGINVKTLADILQNSREANDEFKDTEFISKRNWASFCYDKLIQGITRYKEDHLAYVGGCVLYLEVTVPLNAGTMKTSAGGSCIHSEQDCTNQSSIRQPTDTVNDPLSNLISQYRAGPFVVARSLEHIDIKLIKYIMNEDLEEGETIVQTDKHCLSRNCMLSLAPTRLINVKIIFVIAEMLSTLQQCSEADQCDSWFLPVLIVPQVVSGEGLLQRWVEENVTLTHKNNDLHTCERIIVPVNHRFAHGYLLVVSIQEHCAEIWDPVPTSLTSNLFVTEVQQILNCLDTVLNEEIRTKFGGCFAFRTFSIFQPYSLVKECEAHDYAVYIAMLMKHKRRTIQPAPEIWSSDEEQLRLLLLLVQFESNDVRNKVVENASFHFIETQRDALKRDDNLAKRVRTNRMKSRKMGHGPRK
ncbi:hypothetical protein WN943_010723 [Citrus x changshan-huyou]